MSNKNDCFEYGIIAGVLAGFVAGIILAPEEGEKSRKKIQKAFDEFNERHHDDIKDAKRQLKDSFDLLKYNIERQFRILVNRSNAKKLRKAKELEESFSYNSELN